MSLRKSLLRLMLASLAFSAVAGVLAVFLVGERIMGRILGTGVLIAIASGIMFALSILIDNQKLRWTAIVGLACCGIGAVLLLDAMWWDLFFARSWRTTDRLASSAGVVIAFGAITACSLAGVGTDRRWWRWIGVATAAAAFVMAFFAVWEHFAGNGATITIVTGIAVIVAHANLAFLCNLSNGQEWVRWGTIGAVLVTSLLVDVINATDRGDFDDLIHRGMGAAAIAAGSGTLALLVLSRLNRKVTTKTLPTGVKAMAIVCPWCERKQTLPLGASRCAGCGLKFQIAVEEPRCANCDYLLYMLNSDRCPECGTVVNVQAEATSPATN